MKRDRPTYAELKQRLVQAESDLAAARQEQHEMRGSARAISEQHAAALQEAKGNRERLLVEIQNQRALLDAIIEHLPVGIGIAEVPSGRLLRINERTREIWGLDQMEAGNSSDYGKYIGFHPDGRQYGSEDWQLVRALKGEVIHGEEVLFIRGDGSRRVMRSNAGPVRDADGRIVAAVVVIDDMTDRKKSEEDARAEQNRLKMAQESAGMVTWEWDITSGSVRYFHNLSTIVRGEAVEPYCSLNTLMQEIHPEDRELLAQTLERAGKQGSPWECEYRVHMLDETIAGFWGEVKR